MKGWVRVSGKEVQPRTWDDGIVGLSQSVESFCQPRGSSLEFADARKSAAGYGALTLNFTAAMPPSIRDTTSRAPAGTRSSCGGFPDWAPPRPQLEVSASAARPSNKVGNP